MRISDWSSDVCSSDLVVGKQLPGIGGRQEAVARLPLCAGALREAHGAGEQDAALRYGSRDCGAAIRIIRHGKRKRRPGTALDCNIGGVTSEERRVWDVWASNITSSGVCQHYHKKPTHTKQRKYQS